MAFDKQVVDVEQLIVKHLDLWTSAQTAKSTAGRGSSNKIELTGIKKLRELILELAVRGKLAQQDPNDEPASELLKNIIDQREALVKRGELKKNKQLQPVDESERSFNIPLNWCWSRLGELYDVRDGTHDTPKYVDSGYPLVTSKNLVCDQIDFENVNFISEEDHSKISERSAVAKGDVLMAMIGTIGNPVVVKTDRQFSIKNVALFKFISGIKLSGEFLLTFLKFATVHLKEQSAGGVQAFVSLNMLRNFPIALPPLEEQIRIADKVEELMALCDQLEQQSYQSIDAHNRLVDTLLQTLVDSANADELASNWQRLSEHFDTLFTTEYSIDALKQTILQLAVMGKLVKQDPTDEPASELLKRIAKEKEALVKAGKIKKQKPLPPITDDEKPFELPKGWEWVHLQDIAEDIGTGPFGSMIHKADYVANGVPLINPSHMIDDQIIEDSDISVSHTKAAELSSYKLFTGDIVLARRGEVGRMAIVRDRENGWLCGTGSFYLRLNSEVSREFMAIFFRVKTTRAYLAGNAIGTTMVNLNHGILNSLPVGLPSPSVQKQIVQKVDELLQLCDALTQQLTFTKKIIVAFADALVADLMAR
ncbi:restriction endonuclease subunit S [Rheinheimera faecalis]